MTEHEDLRSVRLEKLRALQEKGVAFPNDFRVNVRVSELLSEHQDADREALETLTSSYSIAGRILLKRVMGKAAFFQIQDNGAMIQIYVQANAVGEYFEEIKQFDRGDIVGVLGRLFRTKTNELTLKVSEIRILVKSLQPLPDKFHGVQDTELRYRQRYVDLFMNQDVREIFEKRASIVSATRAFLQQEGFIEVETPMMHPIPGGATARPFVTHHHTLDMDLYLRIAPELYLKRLIVGGFNRVFEINRSFRNEGISTRHNPEFTMLEFYQAYATYEDLMRLTEEFFEQVSRAVLGTTFLTLDSTGIVIDFSQPFAKKTLCGAVREALKLEDDAILRDLNTVNALLVQEGQSPCEDLGEGQLALFESCVEPYLSAPTFITQYPASVSPLARRNDADPDFCDRFELFIDGREIANGFSELNDPLDQASRFAQQAQRRDAGDSEAMYYDKDYVDALEYGMPPTAGEGIGIDRLVMLLLQQHSIREVIWFPLLRPLNHGEPISNGQ